MSNYVLITGATAGFGEACARIFAKNKWNLIITGRRKERLELLKKDLYDAHDVDIVTLSFDVREQQAVENAINLISEKVKNKLEILINNAGLAVGKGPIDNGIIDDWERMIDTNIKGLLYVSNAVIPVLKSNAKGHIINIGSIAGKEVYPGGNVAYANRSSKQHNSK
jgi:NADP-dependent 3-hydroxy acid dehydrogenase YdfG